MSTFESRNTLKQSSDPATSLRTFESRVGQDVRYGNPQANNGAKSFLKQETVYVPGDTPEEGRGTFVSFSPYPVPPQRGPTGLLGTRTSPEQEKG